MQTTISRSESKAFAKRLTSFLAPQGVSLKHSQALEAVAAMLGFRDYNTLNAVLPHKDSENRQLPYNDITRFLDAALRHNHDVVKGKNPNAVCLAAFSEGQLDHIVDRTLRALEKLGKKAVFINAANKTLLAFYNEIAGRDFRFAYEADRMVTESLYNDDRVLVIYELSKLSEPRRASHMRSLVKVLDDAHFDNVHPKSDLVFIDHASFFEKSYRSIGNYVWMRACTYPWDMELNV